MNTYQTICSVKGAKRLLAGGLWIPLVVALIAVSTAWAADGPPSVDTKLIGADGQTMTRGQLAMKLAARMSPPYSGSDAVGAMAWLTTHFNPPIAPLGGWVPLDQPATVGDLTVCICAQLHIGVSVASGQPTAQDYQNALIGFAGQSTNLSTVQALSNSLNTWVNPTVNPFGPSPSNTPIRTSTGPN